MKAIAAVAVLAPPPAMAAASVVADKGRYEIYAKPQRRVPLPDGRRLNLLCMGRGAPTVILESGWADSDVVWRLVQPILARRTRTCSYDRSGLGFSDRAAGARDADHIVADLEALLKAAHLPPPYVLVGHSLGGLTMRLFADRHRSDVVGMVLVDPTVEDQDRRFAAFLPTSPRMLRQSAGGRLSIVAQEGRGATTASPATLTLPASVEQAIETSRASSDFQLTALAELAAIAGPDSAQIAASRRSYGSLPLVVLTGSENIGNPAYTGIQAAVFRRLWNTMHEEVAGLSAQGVHRQTPGATHLILYENPQAIAAAVREVMDESSAASPGLRPRGGR